MTVAGIVKGIRTDDAHHSTSVVKLPEIRVSTTFTK
jgi:hypothetical protein